MSGLWMSGQKSVSGNRADGYGECGSCDADDMTLQRWFSLYRINELGLVMLEFIHVFMYSIIPCFSCSLERILSVM